MQMPGINVTLERGRAKLYPNLMSFPINLRSRSGFADAPLWLPKVSTSRTSCCLATSLISSNGQLLPCSRMLLNLRHNGCMPKTLLRTSVGLNYFPGPSGESLFASSACPRSKLYLLNIALLCLAASLQSSKLNSGAVGVLQGVCMTSRICLIRSFGQSNVENGGSLRMLFSKVGEGSLCLAASPLSSKLNSGAIGMLHLVVSPLNSKLNSGAVGMSPSYSA